MSDDRHCNHRWPGWCSMRTAVTSFLAVLIVIFTGIMLAGPMTSGTMEGIQLAQGIMALLGPIVGTVIGYYFGAANGERVAEQASRTAEQAVEQKATVQEASTEALESANRAIEAARQWVVDFTPDQAEEPEGNDDGEARPAEANTEASAEP